MKICKICSVPIKAEHLICDDCDNNRELSASFDRIMSGRGLNVENGDDYSVENWIESNKKHHDVVILFSIGDTVMHKNGWKAVVKDVWECNLSKEGYLLDIGDNLFTKHGAKMGRTPSHFTKCEKEHVEATQISACVKHNSVS